MTQTITGLFDNYADAKEAVRRLEAQGVLPRNISIVASKAAHDTASEAGEDAAMGAGLGAVVGGVGGLLTGLGVMAIPGVGPVVAAGWLAATAAGAVAGAVVGGATGGIIGALTAEGVPEKDAHVYAEGIRRGGTLVTARVADDKVAACGSILQEQRSVDVHARRNEYQRSGWNSFDETAADYTADEVRQERMRTAAGR
jgi:hypothetical protein